MGELTGAGAGAVAVAVAVGQCNSHTVWQSASQVVNFSIGNKLFACSQKSF